MQGGRKNGGGETRDSKCTVTFEEQDYDEHSGERGHELGGRVSIALAREAPFFLWIAILRETNTWITETGDPLSTS